jgi:hypothetical protein
VSTQVTQNALLHSLLNWRHAGSALDSALNQFTYISIAERVKALCSAFMRWVF